MHLRLAVPRVEELAALCALGGLVQLAFALKSLLAARRPGPAWSSPPSVRVYVTCKGAPPPFLENARALLSQDYAGPWSVVFVTPASGDPAAVALRGPELAALKPEVLSSGVVPERCSGQAADLVWALAAERPGADVLVFADADGRVGRDWLSELVAPLADPGVGVSSVGAVPVPRRLGGWGLLRAAWVASGLPFFSEMGLVCGQSMAVLRRDFERWDVAADWSRCVGDDFVLARLARAAGRRPRLAFRAMPADCEDCGAGAFWAVLNKWAVYFRVHAPGLWTLALASTAFKVYCVWRGLWPVPRPLLLGALWGGDAAFLALTLLLLASLRPAVFEGLPGGRAALVGTAVLA
ncbi:MAG: glycosyl transferase family protein, partial [Elusimicrobia bacterium]